MTIHSDWTAWRQLSFPDGIAAREIAGVSLATTDSFAAGCIDTYVDRGRLDSLKTAILVDCVSDLEKALPKLTGEATAYFEGLLRLARAVLEQEEQRRRSARGR